MRHIMRCDWFFFSSAMEAPHINYSGAISYRDRVILENALRLAGLYGAHNTMCSYKPAGGRSSGHSYAFVIRRLAPYLYSFD
jgi:hypothetical protein